jgi:aminobenzoyl-glutamate utilization protein A
MSELDDFITERAPNWIALRREFHKHAELGFTEYRTAATLAHRLKALGFAIRVGSQVMDASSMRGVPSAQSIAARMSAARTEVDPDRQWLSLMPDGQTGVVAELSRGEGPVIALRFDIDALPITESTEDDHLPAEQGFSCGHGAMHACGHDGHAAIGMGVAEWLSHPVSDWRGTVRLIFQPAEEGGRGAKPMADAGIVDDVDFFFAAHLGTGLGSGKIGAAAVEMLYSTKLDVRFKGIAAHAGGNPHDGHNALLAGASATLNLHAISRHGAGRSRVNVGKMVAGEGRNIIAAQCALEMEVRGESEEITAFMETRARAILQASADMHDVSVDIEVVGQTIGGPFDEAARAIVAQCAAQTPGVDEVLATWRMVGGEDAPFFMRRVQENGGSAVYFIIGSDLAAFHHANNFDFDEASIATGVGVYARCVARASKHN